MFLYANCIFWEPCQIKQSQIFFFFFFFFTVLISPIECGRTQIHSSHARFKNKNYFSRARNNRTLNHFHHSLSVCLSVNLYLVLFLSFFYVNCSYLFFLCLSTHLSFLTLFFFFSLSLSLSLSLVISVSFIYFRVCFSLFFKSF
jgi:hypothetical protein